MNLPIKNILLICGTHPNDSGVGDLFLRSIGATYADGKIIRFSLTPSTTKGEGNQWLGNQSYIYRYKSSSLPFASTYRHNEFKAKHLSEATNKIKKIIKEEKIDIIWIILSSTALILTAAVLSKEIITPIKISIWDMPDYFFKNQKLSISAQKDITRDFENTLNRASNISVISEGMQKIVFEKFNKNSIIIRHGIEPLQSIPKNKDPRKIKILFAGSLYAKKEWNNFISAIESNKWQISGREVEVYFVGRFPRTNAKKGSRTIFLGTKTLQETIKTMSDMDIGYLPYWFSPSRSLDAQTSFPGKMSAYAAGGLKVFFHAPHYASGVSFLEKYPFGLSCHSYDDKHIIETIKKLIFDAHFCNNEEKARYFALNEALSLDAMKKGFIQFIS